LALSVNPGQRYHSILKHYNTLTFISNFIDQKDIPELKEKHKNSFFQFPTTTSPPNEQSSAAEATLETRPAVYSISSILEREKYRQALWGVFNELLEEFGEQLLV
jgi:hypothetical protein